MKQSFDIYGKHSRTIYPVFDPALRLPPFGLSSGSKTKGGMSKEGSDPKGAKSKEVEPFHPFPPPLAGDWESTCGERNRTIVCDLRKKIFQNKHKKHKKGTKHELRKELRCKPFIKPLRIHPERIHRERIKSFFSCR